MSASFIDSNIFIYLFDESDRRKRQRAEQVITSALEGGSGTVSFQIVQEVLNVLTGKLEAPLEPVDARRFLDQVLVPLWRVMPSERLYSRALEMRHRHRYSFYDSLVIAAALDANCDRLFSEDLQSGQEIEGLTIENPFGQ